MQGTTNEHGDKQWSVWRQDDNANVFLVASGLSEADAKQMVAEYEAKKHKQMYWARRNADAPR